MALLGSLLFPGNPKREKDVNADHLELINLNNFHTELVNSYRMLAENVRTFDSYLMALTAMQYYVVFEEHELENLPDLTTPKLGQAMADSIEELALTGIGIGAAIKGFKALQAGVTNVVQTGGTYVARIGEGVDSFTTAMQGSLAETRLGTLFARSANTQMMTAADQEGFADALDELEELAADMGDALDEIEELDLEMDDALDELAPEVDAVEGGVEVAEGAAETAAAGAEGIAGVAGALLGPALVITIGVTEVLGIINAAKDRKSLEAALERLKGLIKDSNDSIDRLRKAHKVLLTIAKTDIESYNSILIRLRSLEHLDTLDRNFHVNGIENFISVLSDLKEGQVDGYRIAATTNLSDAIDFIRDHAANDAEMATVIRQMRNHLKSSDSDDLTPQYKQELADVNDLDISLINTYDKFRQYINSIASVLFPYHEAIKQAKAPIAPKELTLGKPDPAFVPKPADFLIPMPPKKEKAA